MLLKALSDETRFKIIRFLLDGEKCVCEIIPHAGREQSTVSAHLLRLEAAGILASRREGRRIIYGIKNPKVYGIFDVLGIGALKGKKGEVLLEVHEL